MKKVKRFINTAFVSLLVFSFTALQVQADCINSRSTTPSSQFTDLSNNQDIEVIEDFKTDLMWVRCFHGSNWDIAASDCRVDDQPRITWKEALKAVDAANDVAYLGYTDWRMPNIKELASIVERQCYLPAINTARFPLSQLAITSVFWSNTPIPGTTSIRVVSFADGLALSQDYTATHYLRLVRDVTP